MKKRCNSQLVVDEDRTVFCSLERAHTGNHRGAELTWTDDQPGVSLYVERPRKKPEPVPRAPDGTWSARCQHCAATFFVEVLPEHLEGKTARVTCPKCGQIALYWFDRERRQEPCHVCGGAPKGCFPTFGVGVVDTK
jgi:ribosomal protein S27E